MAQFPKIIQGGMGVGVSNWRLAQAVSRLGQLGVVSGTALDCALRAPACRWRPAVTCAEEWRLSFPEMARRIWQEYFVPGGKPDGEPYPALPMHQKRTRANSSRCACCSNFVEVFLAREGHKNPVGINFLEKVQMPHLRFHLRRNAGRRRLRPDGRGHSAPHSRRPRCVCRARCRPNTGWLSPAPARASLPMSTPSCASIPLEYAEGPLPVLEPAQSFSAIISSNTLATTMLRRANGRVDGFVIEGPTAGGHNAPPRGKLQLNAAGEPVYGERDRVDLDDLRALGVPFWLAGGYGSPQKCAKPSNRARQACRWEPPSPSAGNPACAPTSKSR